MSNPTSGGRRIDAIWDNPAICASHSIVLCAFAATLDYRGDFMEWRYMSIDAFMAKTKLTRTPVKTALEWLVSNGYLEKSPNQTASGKSQSSSFRLSKKLFDEYEIICEEKKKEISKKNKKNKKVKAKSVTKGRGSPKDPLVKLTAGSPKDPLGGLQKTPHLLHNNSSIYETDKTMCVITPDIISPEIPPQEIHTHDHVNFSQIRFRFNNIAAESNGGTKKYTNLEMAAIIRNWINVYGFDIVDGITAMYYDQQGYPLDFRVRELTQLFKEAREDRRQRQERKEIIQGWDCLGAE